MLGIANHYKSKLQWDITLHPLGWLTTKKKLKNRKRVGKDVDKMEHLCTVAGNGATIVENSMMVTQKIKDRITIWSSNTTSEFISKNWKQGLKEIYVHLVHSSIIHNNQRWKWPKCSSADEWINKCGIYISQIIIKP